MNRLATLTVRQHAAPLASLLLSLLILNACSGDSAEEETAEEETTEEATTGAPAPAGAPALEVLPDEVEVAEGEEAPSEENIATAERYIRENFPAAGPRADTAAEGAIARAYAHLDPTGVVPALLLRKALLYFNENKEKFPNRRYISVLAYRRRSTDGRFFVIDMRTGAVRILRMAHGSGSDPDRDGFADRFGNGPGSNRSSLGFALTGETYEGRHGYSLRLDGLSRELNSNLRRRAVVVHGATYVRDAAVIQGRSWGCPAVPVNQARALIDMIKGGSLIYAGIEA